MKRKVLIEKRKHWLKAVSANDAIGAKSLEKKHINTCLRHFHKSDLTNAVDNECAAKCNAVPALHLTKDTVILDSDTIECKELARTLRNALQKK